LGHHRGRGEALTRNILGRRRSRVLSLVTHKSRGGLRPTEARIEDLGALAVVRVYDWKSARNHGYDPMGYKDIPSDDPSRGGRFDATSAHSYSFCYYGVGRNSIEAALWEVAFNKARPLAHQSRLQLQQMEVQDLAFQVAVNSTSVQC
jgi:hypothetical protein